MSKFSDALKQLRKSKGLTQASLAAALGIGKSTISMYEVGRREPDFETLEAIADFFNIPMSYLIDRDYLSTSDDTITNILPIPKMVKLPLLGNIACGDPILAEENIEDYVHAPIEARADFCLRCKGDSMINARIHDGDIVFVRQQSVVENGQIAAVLIGSEATLKRVYISGDQVILQPENAAYAPIIISASDEPIRILGLAVGFYSPLA